MDSRSNPRPGDGLAQGVLEVQYPDGTRKRFRDLDEMDRILNRMKAQVNGGGGRTRRRYASVDKGL